MQINKIRLLESITSWTASFGITAIVIGGGGCLFGLGSVSIIKVSELLSPYRPTIQKTLFYGSAASGAGLFLIGLANGLGVISERLSESESRRIYCDIEEAKRQSKYAQCFRCKYYSSEELLPCALHPNLKENCADWEEID